jgi:hypothetical protein
MGGFAGVHQRRVRLMTRSRIRVFAAVLLAGALLSAPSVSASGGKIDRTAAPSQKFVLIQSDPSESGGPIAATGPIHARGTDVVIDDFHDRFKFPAGNVVIKHKPARSGSSESFDPVTCLFTFIEHGTWKTVNGTGAYADVQGSGTYRVLAQGFGCDENRPPKVFILRIVGKGSLSY